MEVSRLRKMLIEWGDVFGLLLALGSLFGSTSAKKGLGSTLILRGDGQDTARQPHCIPAHQSEGCDSGHGGNLWL